MWRIILVSIIASLAIEVPITSAQSGHVIRGLLSDSLRNDVLAGATVRLVPSATTPVRSDSAGKFQFLGVPAGRYDLFVEHPLLDSLGVTLTVRGLNVNGSGTTSVMLAVPSFASLNKLYCSGDSRPFMVGRVFKEASLAAAANARVLVDWYEVQAGQSGNAAVSYRSAEARTDNAGYYAACGLPDDFNASISAGADSLETAKIAVSNSDIVTLAPWLFLPSSQLAPTLITGTVRNAGRGLSGVVVEVVGSFAKAETDSAGRYTLATQPVGTTLIRARKVGYAPAIEYVNLLKDSTAAVDLELAKPTASLDAIVVRARADVALERSGFSKRAARGVAGRFITQEEITKSKAECVVDLIRRRWGKTKKGRAACSLLAREATGGFLTRRRSNAIALPTEKPNAGEAVAAPTVLARNRFLDSMIVFVDGFQELPDGEEEIRLDWIDTKHVVGIELYPRVTSVAVVIWTTFYRGFDGGIGKPRTLPTIW